MPPERFDAMALFSTKAHHPAASKKIFSENRPLRLEPGLSNNRFRSRLRFACAI